MSGKQEIGAPSNAYHASGLGELGVYRFPSSWIRGRCWERIFCWEMEPRKGLFFSMRHSEGKEHSAAGHIGPGFLPLLLSRGRGPALCLGGQGSDHTPTRDFRKPACASPAPSGLSRLRPLSEIPGLFPSPRTLFEAQSLQSWPTLCDPMGCNVPGSSVHGIFQVRILGRVVMPSSRGSP